MTEILHGRLLHVVGRYDFEAGTGTIDYVSPVERALAGRPAAVERLSIAGETADGQEIFRTWVSPERNSCEPEVEEGTFECVHEVDDRLARLRLYVDGTATDSFESVPIAAADADPAAIGLDLAAPTPTAPTHAHLAASNPPRGARFTVQVRPEGTERWSTIAVGLDEPSCDIDADQFPGVAALETRVLMTHGFKDTEIMRSVQRFQ